MKEEITYFGVTTFRNLRKRFGIKTDDRRRHVYVVGKTGMGKTEMLVNMLFRIFKLVEELVLSTPMAKRLKDYWILFPRTELMMSFILTRLI